MTVRWRKTMVDAAQVGENIITLMLYVARTWGEDSMKGRGSGGWGGGQWILKRTDADKEEDGGRCQGEREYNYVEVFEVIRSNDMG